MRKLNLILLGGLFILAIITHVYAVNKANDYEKLSRYYKQKYNQQLEINKNWHENCKMLEDDLNQQN